MIPSLILSPPGLVRPKTARQWDKIGMLLLLILTPFINIDIARAGDSPDSATNSLLSRPGSRGIPEFSGFGKFDLCANRLVAAGTSDLGEFEISRIKIIPSGKIGYQRMGLDLSVPIPFEFSIATADAYKNNSVDIKLQNMSLWIVEAGLEVGINPTTRIFLDGAASMIMLQRLASFVAATRGQFGTSEWSKHQLDWLTIGAGVAFEALSPFSLIAGLKWDHFDFTLGGRSGATNINAGPYRNLNLTSVDILSDLWIPYVGLGLFGPNCRMSFIGTPFALADVRVRTRLTATIVPSYIFWGEAFTTLYDPVKFIEAKAEYSATIRGVRLSFWGKAAGLSGKGGGQGSNTYATTHPNLKVNILEGDDVTFSRYNFASGLAFGLSF